MESLPHTDMKIRVLRGKLRCNLAATSFVMTRVYFIWLWPVTWKHSFGWAVMIHDGTHTWTPWSSTPPVGHLGNQLTTLHSRKPQASTPNATLILKDPSPPSQPGMSRGRPKVKCICLWVHTHLSLPLWPSGPIYTWQVHRVKDTKGKVRVEEKRQKTRGATAYILLFYLNCLSLSRTISQKNSTFITKQVSYARVKTAVLLLRPLLFLPGHLRWYVYVR